MQPRGLGMPAILAATLAGPFGKSWYSSLTVTPEVLPRTRTVGPVPLAWYWARMNLITCQCRGVSSPMPSDLAIGRANAGDVAAGEQAVPVQRLEGQLAEVVQAGRPQQWQTERAWVMPRHRLGVVVEVDQQGQAAAGLDEAVRVPVE